MKTVNSLFTILLVLSFAVGLYGCQLTEVLNKAQNTNEVVLDISVQKLCGTLSLIAAEREWDAETVTARELFCDTWRKHETSYTS